MSDRNPTIADVMVILQEMAVAQGKTLERVEATHNLAVKTNGRVTKLEGEFIAFNAVEEYKNRQAYQPIAAVKVENSGWDWKTVLTIVLTLATAVTGIVVGTQK